MKKQSKQTAPRPDYDSPWKGLLTRFFPQCLEFFFSDLHAAIDWRRGFEFLDKELQKVSVGAKLGRRLADKLVKVWLRDGREVWVLVHLEIQGEREGDFELRMFVYHYRIFDYYGQRVISLALLTDDDPRWRPDEFGYELFGTSLRLKFRTVKLLDYVAHWEELAASRNPFAVVTMAQLKARETRDDPPAALRWKWWLIRSLYQRGYRREDVRQLFLYIDWMMQLPEELEMKLETMIEEFEAELGTDYVSGMERRAIKRGLQQGLQQGLQKGRQQGLQQGKQQEAAALLLRQLTRRFGELSPTLSKRIAALPLARLERLGEALFDFVTIKDLHAWLRTHKANGKKG